MPNSVSLDRPLSKPSFPKIRPLQIAFDLSYACSAPQATTSITHPSQTLTGGAIATLHTAAIEVPVFLGLGILLDNTEQPSTSRSLSTNFVLILH